MAISNNSQEVKKKKRDSGQEPRGSNLYSTQTANCRRQASDSNLRTTIALGLGIDNYLFSGFTDIVQAQEFKGGPKLCEPSQSYYLSPRSPQSTAK